MRTTLTLDEDVERLVTEAMHARRLPMKAVINDAIRRALSPDPEPAPYRVKVHHASLAPGVDPAGFNRLADELAHADILENLRAHS